MPLKIRSFRTGGILLAVGLWGLLPLQTQAATVEVLVLGTGGENRLSDGTTLLPDGTVVDFGIFYSGGFTSAGTITAQLQNADTQALEGFRANNGWVSFGSVTLGGGDGSFTMAWHSEFPILGTGLELNPTSGALSGQDLKYQIPYLWIQTPTQQFGLFPSILAFPDPTVTGALLQVDVSSSGLVALLGTVGDNGIITQPAGASATPLISSPRSLSAMSTIYGEPSGVVAISVSGSNLTDAITATAPTGLEVSSNGASFGATATFSTTAGSASGTLSIRLKANASAGDYNNQAVVLSSPGAADVDVLTAGTGNTEIKRTLNIAGLVASSKFYDGTTNVTVAGTPVFVGLQNGESFSVTNPISWGFADAHIEPNKTLVQTGTFIPPSGNYNVSAPVLRASINSRRLAVDAVGSPSFSNNTTSITHRLVFDGPVASNTVILVEYRSTLSGSAAWQTNEVVTPEDVATNRVSATFVNSGNSTNEWKSRMFFRIRNT